MSLATTLGQAFEINPKVVLKKGTIASFVTMDDVEPFRRDVQAGSTKPFSGGAKFLPGDVLMARITPSLENGKTSMYVSDDDAPAGGSTEFIVIRGREGISDSRFAYYLFTSDEVRAFAISQMNGSSGRQRVQTDALCNYQIDLPDLDDQIQTASRLNALDDAIESNRRVIKIIPALVRAKVDQALARRFQEVRVASLGSFVNGGAFTKGASGTGRMVLRIAELNSGPGASTVYNDIDVPDEKLARPGDILMSWSGSLGVYRWFRDEAIINQHIFKVIPSGYPAWLVFDRLESVIDVFRGIANDKATTMGHIQRGHLESTVTVLPQDDEIQALDVQLSPLWDRLLLAERECQRLAALRDALRSQLMNPVLANVGPVAETAE